MGSRGRNRLCPPLAKILDPVHLQERGRGWGSLKKGQKKPPGSKGRDVRTRISGLPNERTFGAQEWSPIKTALHPNRKNIPDHEQKRHPSLGA